MRQSRRDFIRTGAAFSLGAGLGRRSASAVGKKYRACIIGDSKQGGYGHELHLAWSARDDVEVVALADPDEEGRRQHVCEVGVERAYADYREMLEKERPDLVSVGPRWTIHHRDYLLACAEVGAQGYLEKPIATSLAEADEMVAAIEKKNLKWAIAHQVRTFGIIHYLKKAVFEGNLIGDVLELRGRGKEDRRAGGEDLIVLGTHIFDLMIFFMGKPKWCVADITTEGRPSTPGDVHEATEPLGPVVGERIAAMFGFEGGVPGYFNTMRNQSGGGGRYGLDLYGSRGVVKIRMGFPPNVLWSDDPTWMPKQGDACLKPLPGDPASEGAPPEGKRNAAAIDDLMAAIEEDRLPQLSLQSGRDAYEMIQAVFASHVHGGRVTLPLGLREHPLVRQ